MTGLIINSTNYLEHSCLHSHDLELREFHNKALLSIATFSVCYSFQSLNEQPTDGHCNYFSIFEEKKLKYMWEHTD